MIDDGYDFRVPEGGNNCIRSILKDDQLICLLEGWYISIPAHHIARLEEYNAAEQDQKNGWCQWESCFLTLNI